MSGTLELVKGLYHRGEYRFAKFRRAPLEDLVQRPPATPLEGVVSALLITMGLLAGAVAIAPEHILAHIPVVHVALAFFVTLASLFVLTDLTLGVVAQAMLQGLFLVIVAAGIAWAL
jgi:hypothetical protein